MTILRELYGLLFEAFFETWERLDKKCHGRLKHPLSAGRRT